MNTPVFHRRRAERFAQLLDEADGGRRRHLRSWDDAELAPLVSLTQQLRVATQDAELELPRAAPPDPEFRTGLRAMLVATAVREGIGVTATTPEPEAGPTSATTRRTRLLAGARRGSPSPAGRRARTRAAVIVGVAAGTLALSGMSAASGDAMPGDALYGVKRSTERAQLTLASSDVSRGQLYLDFARTRVTEAWSVRGGAGLVGLLDDMDAQTRQGVRLLTSASVDRRDLTVLDWVDTFVSGQRPKVAGLVDQARGDRLERVRGSLELLDSITVRTTALRAALGCRTSATGADALGPQPVDCTPR